jgi:hypothetical protein
MRKSICFMITIKSCYNQVFGHHKFTSFHRNLNVRNRYLHSKLLNRTKHFNFAYRNRENYPVDKHPDEVLRLNTDALDFYLSLSLRLTNISVDSIHSDDESLSPWTLLNVLDNGVHQPTFPISRTKFNFFFVCRRQTVQAYRRNSSKNENMRRFETKTYKMQHSDGRISSKCLLQKTLRLYYPKMTALTMSFEKKRSNDLYFIHTCCPLEQILHSLIKRCICQMSLKKFLQNLSLYKDEQLINCFTTMVLNVHRRFIQVLNTFKHAAYVHSIVINLWNFPRHYKVDTSFILLQNQHNAQN